MLKSKNKRGKTVWLVTWFTLEPNAMRQNIAAILNPRWSHKRVAAYVEFVFANKEYTLRERLDLATGRWSNPYPVQWDHLDGVQWPGRMFCGPQMNLYARIVDKFWIEETEGKETPHWEEREKPQRKLHV